MKQKAKNVRKKLVFENTKEKEKSRKRDCRFSKCNKCKCKGSKKEKKKIVFENTKNQETRLPLFKMQPTSAAAPPAARYKGTAISTKTPKRNIVFS